MQGAEKANTRRSDSDLDVEYAADSGAAFRLSAEPILRLGKCRMRLSPPKQQRNFVARSPITTSRTLAPSTIFRPADTPREGAVGGSRVPHVFDGGVRGRRRHGYPHQVIDGGFAELRHIWAGLLLGALGARPVDRVGGRPLFCSC